MDSALGLSIAIALGSTLITAAVGIPLGALLARKRLFGRNALDAFISLPLVLPPTVLGYYLLVHLGRGSAIGTAYERLFGSTIVFTRTGALIAAVVGSLPLVVKGSRAAFESVPELLVTAARSLGASPLRAWREIEVPLAMRGLSAALMLGFARALGDFGATLMVAGDIPGETRTASLAIYDAMQAGDHTAASGLALVLTAFAFVVLYAVNRQTERRS